MTTRYFGSSTLSVLATACLFSLPATAGSLLPTCRTIDDSIRNLSDGNYALVVNIENVISTKCFVNEFEGPDGNEKDYTRYIYATVHAQEKLDASRATSIVNFDRNILFQLYATSCALNAREIGSQIPVDKYFSARKLRVLIVDKKLQSELVSHYRKRMGNKDIEFVIQRCYDYAENNISGDVRQLLFPSR